MSAVVNARPKAVAVSSCPSRLRRSATLHATLRSRLRRRLRSMLRPPKKTPGPAARLMPSPLMGEGGPCAGSARPGEGGRAPHPTLRATLSHGGKGVRRALLARDVSCREDPRPPGCPTRSDAIHMKSHREGRSPVAISHLRMEIGGTALALPLFIHPLLTSTYSRLSHPLITSSPHHPITSSPTAIPRTRRPSSRGSW
jgi:hypothetical protein